MNGRGGKVTAEQEGARAALIYVIDLINSRDRSYYKEAYRGALRDMAIHVEAAIYRLDNGEPMESRTPLAG